ncbi:MAG: hypothetical protein MUE65_03055 [Methanomassiliicoccales archaeon]|jgi:hypothetical protein|nr:hypothetical protein [Methanomassiliicoccales archaeon]
MRFKVLRVCQSKGFSIVPQEVVRYDLDRAAALLEAKGFESQQMEVMLLLSKDGVQTTMYVNGRLMLQPIEDKEYARSLAESFYEMVEAART